MQVEREDSAYRENLKLWAKLTGLQAEIVRLEGRIVELKHTVHTVVQSRFALMEAHLDQEHSEDRGI